MFTTRPLEPRPARRPLWVPWKDLNATRSFRQDDWRCGRRRDAQPAEQPAGLRSEQPGLAGSTRSSTRTCANYTTDEFISASTARWEQISASARCTSGASTPTSAAARSRAASGSAVRYLTRRRTIPGQRRHRGVAQCAVRSGQLHRLLLHRPDAPLQHDPGKPGRYRTYQGLD